MNPPEKRVHNLRGPQRSPHPFRRARGGSAAVLGLSACLATAACGQTTLDLSEVVLEDTTFELVRLNGQELPAAVPFGGGSIVSGSFTLTTDGQCTRAIVFSDGAEPTPTETESTWACGWSLEDDTLTLRWLGAPEGAPVTPVAPTSATLVDDRLTLLIDTGIVCVTTPCPTRYEEVYRAPTS